MIANATTDEPVSEIEILRTQVETLKRENAVLFEALKSNEDRRHWHPEQDKRRNRKPKGARTTRTPLVYAYCRVSHLESVESGLGIATQIDTFQRWWEFQRGQPAFVDAKLGSFGWRGGMVDKFEPSLGGHAIPHGDGAGYTDGMFIDLGISAYSVPFCARPAGGKLDAILKPGDRVVFPRMDRGFRNLRDFSNTQARWEEDGIGVIFVDPDINLSTAVGMLTAQILSAIAEFQSKMKSERSQEVCRLRMLQGLMSNRPLPAPGFKFVGGRNVRPCWNERRYISKIMELREEGHSYHTIATRIETIRARDENRKPGLPKTFNKSQRGYTWTHNKINSIHKRQLKYPVTPLFEAE